MVRPGPAAVVRVLRSFWLNVVFLLDQGSVSDCSSSSRFALSLLWVVGRGLKKVLKGFLKV